MTLLKKIDKIREISSLFFLVFLFGLVGLVNSDLLTPTSLFNYFNDSVVFTMLTVRITFAVLTGGIDVSIGATLGLSAVVTSTILHNGGSGIFAVLVVVLVSYLVGLFNEFGIAKLGIPSLIFTLDANGLMHGLVCVYTDGAWIENLPAGFTKMVNIKLIGELTTFYAAALVLAVTTHLILIKTQRGKYFVTVGDDPAGATMIGIPTMQAKVMAYALCGLFASTASMLHSSHIGFITPTAGSGYEMRVIVACVLGGASLSGGLGSLIGTSIGAAIMSSISRVLVFLGFPSNYDNTIASILLIAIVVVDAVTQSRAAAKTRHARLASRSGPLEEEPGNRRATP